MNDDFELIRGSGNVFRDFGRRNAGVEQARAILAARIIRTPDERGLSTREAEKLTGVSHSESSRIRHARLERACKAFEVHFFGGVLSCEMEVRPMTEEQKISQRLKAVENAVAQQRLEELEVPPDVIEEMKRAARGEIVIEEGIFESTRRSKFEGTDHYLDPETGISVSLRQGSSG